MSCVLTRTPGGFTGVPGKLTLTLVDPAGTTQFACNACSAWDFNDSSNPVRLTGKDDGACTATTYTITLNPGIFYRIELGYVLASAAVAATLKESPCGQVLTFIDAATPSQILLINVPTPPAVAQSTKAPRA